MSQYRRSRIAEEIRKNLDRVIREELRDPRIAGTFSITRVEAAKDLRYAKVFVSALEEDKLDGMVTALKGASGLLRHALGSAIQLRFTPELQFVADRNIAYGLHIASRLKEVMASVGNAEDARGGGAQSDDIADEQAVPDPVPEPLRDATIITDAPRAQAPADEAVPDNEHED
ncbi:MAG TPA: 30S ribosome-binding factor RbfA [Candidatus Limnocylindria bacterium]|nr:30S ribosome-binding factor RbfA [Candidatus Limnocylindria bacterium]